MSCPIKSKSNQNQNQIKNKSKIKKAGPTPKSPHLRCSPASLCPFSCAPLDPFRAHICYPLCQSEDEHVLVMLSLTMSEKGLLISKALMKKMLLRIMSPLAPSGESKEDPIRVIRLTGCPEMEVFFWTYFEFNLACILIRFRS